MSPPTPDLAHQSPPSSGGVLPSLVVGCGYLGSRVADAWRDRGRTVYAVTRTRAAEFAARGLVPVIADVLDPASLDRLRDLPPLGSVLYAVGLDRRAGRGMREVYVDGLAHVLARLPRVDRFLYASSTGVYGQTGGEWVDADSPTEPAEESGRVVLAAEAVLRSHRPDAVVLRFAGLYGPGRLLRGAAIRAGEPFVGDADKWLNLQHVADAARAVLEAEEIAPAGGTLLVSDGTPVTRRDFYTTLAELLGAPAAKFEPGPPNEEPNRRVRRWGGFAPAFPTWREGLADAAREAQE